MPQPVSNDPYYHLNTTAAGTVKILDYAGDFSTYTVGTVTTGTVTFFDCAGTAGTTAANQLMSYTGALRDARPQVALKRGLVALVSGTVDAVIGCG